MKTSIIEQARLQLEEARDELNEEIAKAEQWKGTPDGATITLSLVNAKRLRAIVNAVQGVEFLARWITKGGK